MWKFEDLIARWKRQGARLYQRCRGLIAHLASY